MHKVARRRMPSLGLGVLFLMLSVPAFSAERSEGREIESATLKLQGLRLEAPITTTAVNPLVHRRMDPALIGTSGPQQVIVRLRSAAVGQATDLAAGEKVGRKAAIETEQTDFMARVQSVAQSAREIARTQLVLNAVFIEIDAADLDAIALDPDVLHIKPIGNYELHLSETVPYIGASAVQSDGFDGKGISVAVLDSGIDYLHANLGGSGDPAEYAANDPDIVEPGTFPTADVVGGFDFVGEIWPFGPLAPDADPLDFEGHGTHVADIIGGNGGVAPGVDLYAVKVCSAVATSCSGVALIQGMEFAVDPNGDGDPSDAVDIINMSLGADYGQPFDDDLSAAVDAATGLGVLTVSSAGNGGDRPYVVGSPGAADTALAVAQTQVPSAELQLITVDGVDYPGVFQAWSASPVGVTAAQVVYGDGAGGNLDGCAPFAAGTFAGEIVLVDRGGCFFTTKIFNVQEGGGSVGIIGLVAPGAPFSGAFADPGGAVTIPGFMISQADSIAIQIALLGGGGAGVIDAANQLPLVMSMVSSSSRGPRSPDNGLKPEIGAPGASVSAQAGTGTDETPFGGTSGASPMVAGAAALLLDKYSGLDPSAARALLIGTGETAIVTDPFSGFAPVSRIGGGEVRVDSAANAKAYAYDVQTGQGALSFGFIDVYRDIRKVSKELEIANLTDHDVTYSVTPTFRYGDDVATGAMSVRTTSKTITVPGKGTARLKVELRIDASLLPGNFMNAGSGGNNPDMLTINEFDGYVILDDGHEPLNVPWHVLPRKAASVTADTDTFAPGGFPAIVGLTNNGAGTGQMDAYSLLAVSPNQLNGERGQQSPMPDIRAVGINTIPVPPGFCSADASFIWLFAFNTWERQTHLVPIIHQVLLDIDQDAIWDYAVFNFDLSLSGAVSDGRQLAWAQDLATGDANAFFFAEHSMNAGNTALFICAEQVGLTGADLLATNVTIDVSTFDWYFGGPGDTVGQLTVTPLGERFFAVTGDVPGNAAGAVNVFDFGGFPGNSEELGVLMFANGDRGPGNRGGATHETETVVIGVEGADLRALKIGAQPSANQPPGGKD